MNNSDKYSVTIKINIIINILLETNFHQSKSPILILPLVVTMHTIFSTPTVFNHGFPNMFPLFKLNIFSYLIPPTRKHLFNSIKLMIMIFQIKF
jgi:hypothetical protein